MSRRKKCCYTPLGRIVAEAEAEGMSYGKYVAQQEAHLYRHPRQNNTPSTWVHPQRTLLEGLNKELRNLETRAEYLNDPEAKCQLLIAEANARERKQIAQKVNSAERRVRTWCREMEVLIKKKGKNTDV